METVKEAPAGARKVEGGPVRWRVVLVAAAFFAAAGVSFLLGRASPLQATVPEDVPGEAGVASDVGEDPGVWFALQVDTAWEQLRSSGMLDTSAFAAPLQVASDQVATVVVVALLDDVCYFGGVVDGARMVVSIDPSASACSAELFAELEVVLASPPDAVVRALGRAAAEAYRFASLGLTPGAPLSGFSASGGVAAAVAPDGARVVLSLAGWCVEVVPSAPDSEASLVRCR